MAHNTIERVHKGERPAGRLYFDDEISVIFYMSRRARSAEFALRNFEKEAEMLGDDFDLELLSGREFGMIVTAEVLGLVARWDSRPEVGSAAALASSGLRSAFWLWLEDDDRAMGVLRVVLESVSRLRTWNRNPTKAAKLEARAATTPRDWLEAAGWRRLHALNLALGELAHTRENSRWTGARDLLVALQPPGEDPALAPHRGRGFALDSIIALAAKTVLESVDHLSPELKEGIYGLMDNTSIFSDHIDQELEKWLTRTWDQRSFDLGSTDFVRPPIGS